MKDLAYYTMNAGSIRASPRSEVSDGVIAAMQKWTVPGTYDLPARPYQVHVPPVPHGFMPTVFRPGKPIATMGVANSEMSEAFLWGLLETLYLRITERRWAKCDFAAPHCPATLPWASVVLMFVDESLSWLVEFQRSLAWAWLESQQEKQKE